MTLLKRILCAAALTAVAGAPALAAETGASLFQENCSACHQAKGEGVPGAFPALVGNKFVLGDPKGPAYVLTHGRGGMPNFSEDLDDRQMAAIISYIRSAWGNKAQALDPTLVASVRSAGSPPNDTGANLPFH